jgi:putative hemolysin
LVGHLIDSLRGDVKIMTHSLLCQPPEARDVLLPVDFGDGPEARRTSLDTRARAQAWLAAGHAVVVFPAGSVATSARPWSGPAVDAEWHPFVTRLAAQPGVTTLPLFLHGQNSRLFQIASHMHYTLRLGLLIKEFKSRTDEPVQVVIGDPIASARLQPLKSNPTAMMEFLRRATYDLSPEPLKSYDLGYEFEAKYKTR